MAGGRVGYSVRGETRRSAATRIEVVTTGLLVRRLQADPDREEIKRARELALLPYVGDTRESRDERGRPDRDRDRDRER